MDIGKGNAKFFRQRSFPHHLFAVGNRASTRLISSVAVSIASRKAISLAGDGRPGQLARRDEPPSACPSHTVHFTFSMSGRGQLLSK
jgi:hypothetical protein